MKAHVSHRLILLFDFSDGRRGGEIGLASSSETTRNQGLGGAHVQDPVLGGGATHFISRRQNNRFEDAFTTLERLCAGTGPESGQRTDGLDLSISALDS